MVCSVIFGESNEKHTRHYLYYCTKEIVPGDLVLVPVKHTVKTAIVQKVFCMMPENITIEPDKIKEVVSKSGQTMGEAMARSYLLALIDEYKDGNCTKKELYAIMEHAAGGSEIKTDDVRRNQIINRQLLEKCRSFVAEPNQTEETELGFWKELKDIEYKLRYGYSFWTKSGEQARGIKRDPIEYTDNYLKIELKLERLIRAEIGDGGEIGFCHKYWQTKKRVLKERFGMEWKSPGDLNPTIQFD